MTLTKRPLKVRYAENLADYKEACKFSIRLKSVVGSGIFIWVWIPEMRRYEAIMDLKFVRERDAIRAVAALMQAGLGTHYAMVKAGGMRVKQVACEALQW
jgi:hypothetical protein